MSTDSFEDEVMEFLRRNFPQIQMHGGEATVHKADADTGEVKIMLNGACSGCGISPMTIQAIKSRMTDQMETVEIVKVVTGESSSQELPSFNSNDTDDEHINAPF